MAVKPLLEFYGELRGGRNVSAEVDYWLERLGLAEWSAAQSGNAQQGDDAARAVHRGGGRGAETADSR